MSKPSGIISNRKVEALHPATLKGRGFTAGQGKVYFVHSSDSRLISGELTPTKKSAK